MEFNNRNSNQNNESNQENGVSKHGIEIPQINLPKSGSIHGLGEKFSPDLFTGTGNLSIPIYASPGRSGFQPELNITYSSGNGNGIFGLGWNFSLPNISRKTEKGLPQYKDSVESDTYILSGAEDLVPAVDNNGNIIEFEDDQSKYRIVRYRPRIEGLFARIEKWINKNDTSDKHWRTITKENITSIYGYTQTGRIAFKKKIFSWLIEQQFDDKGNLMVFNYDEDATLDKYHKKAVTKYIKSIFYGNEKQINKDLKYFERLDTKEARRFYFKLIFDYGDVVNDSDGFPTLTSKSENIKSRIDPFSTFKPGFEIRHLRSVCKRIICFHDFPKIGNQEKYQAPVKSTNFKYDEKLEFTKLIEVEIEGFDYERKLKETLPPVQFEYHNLKVENGCIEEKIQTVSKKSLDNLPEGLSNQYILTKLDGEPLPGILVDTEDILFYKKPLGLSSCNGVNELEFGELSKLKKTPHPWNFQNQQLIDVDADSKLELCQFSPDLQGFYSRNEKGDWNPFIPFKQIPNIDWQYSNLKFNDQNNNGRQDAFIKEDDKITIYPSIGRGGFDEPYLKTKVSDEFSDVISVDEKVEKFIASISGEGLPDIITVTKSFIAYKPALGYGNYGNYIIIPFPGDKLDSEFDPKNIRFGDFDGSGTLDIVYLDAFDNKLFFNRACNSFSDPIIIKNIPPIDKLSNLQVDDITGCGTSSIVWTKYGTNEINFINISGGIKPHLLKKTINNLGGETEILYTSSTEEYLRDKKNGNPWITELPFPVQVIKKITVIDKITHDSYTSEFEYSHGVYNNREKEFVGFCKIVQKDVDSFTDKDLDQAPIKTISWFHPGLYKKAKEITEYFFENEYFNLDDKSWRLKGHKITDDLSYEEKIEANHSLKGKLLHQEVYGLDGSADEVNPYTVTDNNYNIKCAQYKYTQKHAVFYPVSSESISYHYERYTNDPRIAHKLVLESDEFGNILKEANLVYPRRNQTGMPQELEQKKLLCTVNEQSFAHLTNNKYHYLHSVPIRQLAYELTGFQFNPNQKVKIQELFDDFKNANLIAFHEQHEAGLNKRVLNNTYQTYQNANGNEMNVGDIDQLPLLPFQNYQMAFTPTLFNTACTGINNISANDILGAKGKYGSNNNAWWIRSGIQKFDKDKFYAPTIFVDPFTEEINDPAKNYQISYDAYDFLQEGSIDPIGNEVSIKNDYRVLQPIKSTDINGNFIQYGFDELGLLVATAIAGKNIGDLDSLEGFDYNIDMDAFFNDPINISKEILYKATTCIVYDFKRYFKTKKQNQPQPISVATIARENHNNNNNLQISMAYQDGLGRELQSKLYAGIEGWLTSGLVEYNNKANVIRAWEPLYTVSHQYEKSPQNGVSATNYYDAPGRLIKTILPDKSLTRVEFNPWSEKHYDQNDTCKESEWEPELPKEDDEYSVADKNKLKARIKQLSEAHADTYSEKSLDVLGRPYKTIERLSNEDNGKVISSIDYDISGNQVKIYDALYHEYNGVDRPPVMQSIYDMLGNAVRNSGMDDGTKILINDLGGNPVLTYDDNKNHIEFEYDRLRRPTKTILKSANDKVVNYTEYGSDKSKNLNGQIEKLNDGSGLNQNERFDEKGNVLITSKRLHNLGAVGTLDENKIVPDWKTTQGSKLENELFRFENTYDALGRLTDQQISILKDDDTKKLHRTNYAFNLLGQLKQVKSSEKRTEVAYNQLVIRVNDIKYNAKGQRLSIIYGNNVKTNYTYYTDTFRLKNLKTFSYPNHALQNIFYTYDPIGNILEIEDTSQETSYHDGQENKPICRYEYDALYRLVKAEGREHIAQNTPVQNDYNDIQPISNPANQDDFRYYKQEYTYDKNGNIEQMAHSAPVANASWVRNYVYENANDRKFTNKLLKTTNNSGNTTGVFDYDSNGSMTKMSHLDEMKWDYRNQLIKTKKTVQYGNDNPIGTIWYQYDQEGQRTRKIVKTNSTKYKETIYLGNYELYREWDTKIKNEVETLHVVDDTTRIALLEYKTIVNTMNFEDGQPVVRYQLNNHLNSSHIEVDISGTEISREEYHLYGSTSYLYTNTGISQKKYRFNGKEKDIETNLYYYGARYYCTIGRWCSCDPVGFVDGLCLYEYVTGNPAKYLDKDGNGRATIVQHGLQEVISWAKRKTLKKTGQKLYGGTKKISQRELLKLAKKLDLPDLPHGSKLTMKELLKHLEQEAAAKASKADYEKHKALVQGVKKFGGFVDEALGVQGIEGAGSVTATLVSMIIATRTKKQLKRLLGSAGAIMITLSPEISEASGGIEGIKVDEEGVHLIEEVKVDNIFGWFIDILDVSRTYEAKFTITHEGYVRGWQMGGSLGQNLGHVSLHDYFEDYSEEVCDDSSVDSAPKVTIKIGDSSYTFDAPWLIPIESHTVPQ